MGFLDGFHRPAVPNQSATTDIFFQIPNTYRLIARRRHQVLVVVAPRHVHDRVFVAHKMMHYPAVRVHVLFVPCPGPRWVGRGVVVVGGGGGGGRKRSGIQNGNVTLFVGHRQQMATRTRLGVLRREGGVAVVVETRRLALQDGGSGVGAGIIHGGTARGIGRCPRDPTGSGRASAVLPGQQRVNDGVGHWWWCGLGWGEGVRVLCWLLCWLRGRAAI